MDPRDAASLYPLAITAIAQLAFKDKANGSLVVRDGKIIGSALLAQQFQGTNYFWPRPSACTYGTGPSGLVASSGSNLGPTSAPLQTNVMNNVAAFISGNNLPTNTVVPADMVFASASGLDPHISPEAARLQIARVAASRGVSEDKVKALVDRFTEPPAMGFPWPGPRQRAAAQRGAGRDGFQQGRRGRPRKRTGERIAGANLEHEAPAGTAPAATAEGSARGCAPAVSLNGALMMIVLVTN